MIGLLKYGTPTSQRFHVVDESDTGGVAGVYVDGKLYTGDTLSASNDYSGMVEVTGLSPGTHTWDVALDGVAAGNQKTFQTAPAKGEDFKIVFIGDVTGAAHGLATITNENARYGISIGDSDYLDTVPTYGDRCGCAALPTGSTPVVFSDVLTAYRCRWRCGLTYSPMRPNAFSEHQWELNWNNHEFETPPFQAMTNADDSGLKYQAAKQAADEYLFVGGADATGAWDSYPNPRVYRDFIVGDVHVLVFDHTSYGFVTGKAQALFEGSVPDGAGGTNTGSQQLDWAIATMQASTSKFIFLVTPAEPVHISAEPTAGAQWETLLSGVDGLSGKTVVLFCGDTHQMLVETLGGTKLPNNPLVVVNGTPLEHPSRSSASDGWVDSGDGTRHVYDMAEPLQAWVKSKKMYEGTVCYPTTKNGFYYTATSTGTTDAVTEPTWPTTIGDTVTDGTVTWVCREDKLDPHHDYNYNYVTAEVFPNGSKLDAKPHVLITIKNALTGQPRTQFYVREGERNAIFPNDRVGGLMS